MTTAAELSLEDQVLKARDRANTLVMKAQDLEAKARRARRRANSAQLHYQHLLRRYRGEEALPFPFGQD